MRYLGILLALVFAIAGAYGVFGAHDNGGWPIFAVGVITLAYLLTRPAAVAAPAPTSAAPPAPSKPGPKAPV